MTFNPIAITGNQAFDYFFSLVFVFGLIAIGPALLFRLLKY